MSSTHVAVIGSGTIGLSFAALHLSKKSVRVTIYDPRPDLTQHVAANLPQFLSSTWPAPPPGEPIPAVDDLTKTGRLTLSPDLIDAVKGADIVQEQGPENVDFKQSVWPRIEAAAPAHALFWSSTSGIPASVQAKNMQAPERLFVVHPFNPPHVMPLLELVPHPKAKSTDGSTESSNESESNEALARTLRYWRSFGREPAVLKEEIAGFVANRLSAAVLQQAAYLVDRGVADPATIDSIVEQSMGPRWAVRGPFWSYHAGGGVAQGDAPGGLRGLLSKIGSFRDDSWLGQLPTTERNEGGWMEWEEKIIQQTEAAYGKEVPEKQLEDRDSTLKKVLDATRRET